LDDKREGPWHDPSAMNTFAPFRLLALALATEAVAAQQPLLTGEQAMGDWRSDAPGVRRHITVKDLPPPASHFFSIKPPRLVGRPAEADPQVMAGFKVQLYASDLRNPRFLLTAPNGDIFVSESGANAIKVLRDNDHDGKPDVAQVFADANLNRPFGIAFYPPGPDPKFVYIANTDSIVRIPYRNGDIRARAPAETLASLSRGAGLLGGGGHWTRDIVFPPDGKKMYVSIGSYSNNSDNSREKDRARIFELNPDGTERKVFAWGIRNAVGIAFRPGTNELWMSTNERDELGDNLPPDYISRVQPRGFYGWPWFYIGNHPDPKHKGEHSELADKSIVPDVLIQSHSASLNLCFYNGNQFPAEYRGDIFAALHGSWNRNRRTGYKIIRVPFNHDTGKPLGEYQDFVTGFVTAEGQVWGRPVGITVAKDGALLFSEDGNNTIWRVAHE
jgi:glucose/arabinose dehydrogenase